MGNLMDNETKEYCKDNRRVNNNNPSYILSTRKKWLQLNANSELLFSSFRFSKFSRLKFWSSWVRCSDFRTKDINQTILRPDNHHIALLHDY